MEPMSSLVVFVSLAEADRLLATERRASDWQSQIGAGRSDPQTGSSEATEQLNHSIMTTFILLVLKDL